jgi:hypothetical protein
MTRDEKSEEKKAAAEDKQKQKQADIMIRHAKRESELFHTPDGETWADINIRGHRETWLLRSKGFKRWLVMYFREMEGATPSKEVLNLAIDTLDAIAAIEGDERQVYLRTAAELDGIVYVDLCDKEWRAIEISAGGGWRIIDRPPLRFRRSPAMLPLPEPKRGGSINLLRPYLNVRNDSDFVLVVAWLLAALRPRGPYPVLALSGEHGAAKSTFAKMMRALVDPNELPIRRPPKEERDLFIAANGAHMLALDNLSEIPAWLSDALCTLATEGAFSTRRLYTDAEEQLFRAQRPVVTNGITTVVTRPDLADRALFLALGVIDEERRRDESELWRTFENDRAKILGALLDAVAVGLRRLPEIKLDRKPRMADFAVWIAACETALWPAGTFAHAYAANRASAVEETLEHDPVASAVRILTQNSEEWAGVTKRLLAKLGEIVGEQTVKSREWPRSEKGLTTRLKHLATFLRRAGITVTWAEHRTNQGRVVTIRRRHLEGPAEPSQPSQPSRDGKISSIFHGVDGVTVPVNSPTQSSQKGDNRHVHAAAASDGSDSPHPTVTPTVTRNPLKTKGCEGSDDSDGSSPTSWGPNDPGPIPDFLVRQPPASAHGNAPALGPPGDSLDDFQ